MPRVGTPLTINWSPDPIVFAEAIMEVDAALMRTGIPLAEIGREVRMDIKERFATRTSPDGMPWEPYSEYYEPKAAEYPNIGMLRRDDWMYQAVTNEDAIIVTNNEMFFNENQMANIPPSSGRKTGRDRGYFQQEGTSKMPARPFLGLTTETRVFVDAAFAEWFDDALRLFTRKGGKLGTQHQLRGAGGRFIPRSTPLPSFMRRR